MLRLKSVPNGIDRSNDVIASPASSTSISRSHDVRRLSGTHINVEEEVSLMTDHPGDAHRPFDPTHSGHRLSSSTQIVGSSAASLAVFHTPQEFRVVDGSTTLGTPPVERPIRVGSLIAGRRWRVFDVDPDKKLIQLTPSSGGKPPPFTTGALQVADTVRKRMRATYRSDHRPAFLDDAALTLLQQGRTPTPAFSSTTPP